MKNKDFHYTLEESLGYITRKTSKLLGRLLLKKFREAGHEVSIDQWIILAYLFRFDGQNQQQLSEALRRDKTAVTRIINQMEAQALLERRKDKVDRRQNLLVLTPEGIQLYQALLLQAEKTLQEATSGIKAKEIDNCMHTLKKICINLTEKLPDK